MSWESALSEAQSAGIEALRELIATIAELRHPERGCPWDLSQTHESLRRYMLEEAYEAAAAMTGSDPELLDELGDVLLQVLLNAQLASDRKAFSITDVAKNLNAKMIRRHPHVFAKDGSQQSEESWESIKAQEKGRAKNTFAELKASQFPALTQALKIGKVAKKIDFDWKDWRPVFDQVVSEVKELEVELNRPQPSHKALLNELGDVFFSMAQLCRHLDLDPETVALTGNQKFLRRFQKMEDLAQEQGLNFDKLTLDDKESLWQAAKKFE